MRVKVLLKHAMGHHTDLAISVLDSMCPRKPKTRKDYDAYEVALTVFLAGIDKTLGMACVMLYVAGVLDKDWATPFKYEDTPGTLICTKFLGKKIEKLRQLGAIKAGLEDFVAQRNAFMHGYEAKAHYILNIVEDGDGLVAKAAMTFGAIDCFPNPFNKRIARSISKAVVEDLNTYITTQTEFDTRFRKATDRLDALPEFVRPGSTHDRDELMELLNGKTTSLIGQRWQHLLS